MELQPCFEAHSRFESLALMDDLLWLPDVPLNNMCLNKRKATIFPMNLAIKDWAAFKRIVNKTTDGSYMDLGSFMIEDLKRNFPAFSEDIDNVFAKDAYVVEGEVKGITINYGRTYDFLRLWVNIKNYSYDELKNYLEEHQSEIEKDFSKEFLKVIKANEMFVRVAILIDVMYCIFDKEEPDKERYIQLFEENNKWVFNAKADKFNAAFASLKTIIEGYRASGNFDKEAVLAVYKPLAEYRRTLFQKANELEYNFYLDYVD